MKIMFFIIFRPVLLPMGLHVVTCVLFTYFIVFSSRVLICDVSVLLLICLYIAGENVISFCVSLLKCHVITS